MSCPVPTNREEIDTVHVLYAAILLYAVIMFALIMLGSLGIIEPFGGVAAV